MIKSKEKHKFFIEQYILNNINNFQEWSKNTLNSILKENAIIGYLFSTREGNLLCAEPRVLNLYLINRKYYRGTEITLESLLQAWELFLFKCNTETNKNKKLTFVNPPIKEFIDTKENWCKKLATQLSRKYHKSFDEALSDVYYAIMRCYTRSNVYIGNLGYIEKTAHTLIMLEKRLNKVNVNQDSNLACSLDQKIVESDDGEELTLLDIIAGDNKEMCELEYEQLKIQIANLLSKDFTSREIYQLLNKEPLFLPINLYKRLVLWRMKHKESELYE